MPKTTAILSSQVSLHQQDILRAIDHAIANNEVQVPSVACTLPSLLRKVHECKSFKSFQAEYMTLMFSVKSACKNGWFTEKDADDLLLLAKEVKEVFSSEEDINVEPSSALTFVSKVMSRFYPHMKMDKILVSVRAKPGFHPLLADFQISRNVVDFQKEKIKLFVARTDVVDTSSCIISPPEVSFLLNGTGVSGRTNISMKFGPQLPTKVTAMLDYGTNLLQAIGRFDGPYIIVIATMSRLPSLSTVRLQDYDQSLLASVDSDTDITGTSSGVSLNCPISQRRIRVPVKGRLCKHLQCFDYDDYLKTNLRQPSWQCPYCKLSVFHMDLRIDQNIAKVLREVGEDVVRVVFSKDGSWKPFPEKNHPSSQQHTKSGVSPAAGTLGRASSSSTRIEIKQEPQSGKPSVQSASAKVEAQLLPSMVSPDGKSQTAASPNVALGHLPTLAQMTKHLGPFTAPGSSGSSLPRTGTAYDSLHWDTKRNEGPPVFHVNTPQAPNLASSIQQDRLLSQRKAHPLQGSAGASYISSTPPTFQQTAQHNSNVMNPSQNLVTSPLAGRVSQIQLRGSIQQQPWLPQAPNLNSYPVNSPVPARTTLVQQRDGLLQPTGVNTATNRPQNPCAYSFSMEKAGGGSSAAAAGRASDPNWRPSKRMRGSLTGEAYSAALRQFMSPPPAPPAPLVVRAPRLPPPPGFFPNLAVPPPPGFLPKLAATSPLSGASSSSKDQNPPNPNP